MILGSISTKTLTSIAVYGGVVTLGGAIYFSSKIHQNIRATEPYQKSMALLRGYPPAEHHIGKPILGKRVDLGDRDENYIYDNSSKFVIPVYGPKGKGQLFSWASRPAEGDSWEVDRLDLYLDSHKIKWTFYDRNSKDGGSSSSEENEKELNKMLKDWTPKDNESLYAKFQSR